MYDAGVLHSSRLAVDISPTGKILVLFVSDSCGERLQSDGTLFSLSHTHMYICTHTHI